VEESLRYCDGYDASDNEFKFQRGPRNFDCVVNFLRTGVLHLGEETCVIAFQQVSRGPFLTSPQAPKGELGPQG
jgi:hypothetical protein